MEANKLEIVNDNYQNFPICETVSHKLNWSHICELVKINDPLERSFYGCDSHAQYFIATFREQISTPFAQQRGTPKLNSNPIAR
jgi:hypothetical protein